MSLRAIHDFELRLLEPCLGMSARGIKVDEPKRQQMLADLDQMIGPLQKRLTEIVVTEILLAKLDGKIAGLPKSHLFQQTWVCPCCRGGKLKTLHCHTCAGLPKAPTKTKEREALPLCRVCKGEAKRTTLTFNPGSDEQVKIVLYDILRLPKRTKDGKLRSDEDALKDLLAHVTDETVRELILSLLKLAKVSTIRSILERIEPGPDGRIRSFYNPAGTETGRFSSSESFLVASTNLQNIPKREVTDPRFDVRRCIVADPGYVLVEADLSGAEAWVTAACSGDHDLLAKLRLGPKVFDVHKWTAGHIFSKEPTSVDKKERTLGKMARHALNYGMQWQTFQRNVNAEADKTGVAIDANLAQTICFQYHELHPGLENWWHDVQRRLGAAGYSLTTCFGRKRSFFGREPAKWLSEAHREAIAFEPQSTVADLLNRGMLRWWERHEGRLGQLLAQIHDAVLIQVPQARVELASQMLRRCLEEEIEVHGVKLTIPVDVVTSEHWGAWKEAA